MTTKPVYFHIWRGWASVLSLVSIKKLPNTTVTNTHASFKDDGAAIFIKMSIIPSATFSRFGHQVLLYFMKNRSKG
jgi:hypothetical protein